MQAAITADQQRAAAAACAASIGPARAFYSTADHAEDLEAVRAVARLRQDRALRRLVRDEAGDGLRLAHPDHVDRLVLDSVLPPDLPDPYSANVARATCRRR